MTWQGLSLTYVRVLVAGCLAAALLLFAASRADGAIVADNGFRSDADGYSFTNPGDGIRGLTTAEMRRLFGNAVCSSVDAQDRCTLSPEAEAWMEATNGNMGDGHCFGMAGSSQMFFMNKGPFPDPMPFGSATVPGLELDGNPKLQSFISYMFTLQFMPAVRAENTNVAPKTIAQQLERQLTAGNAEYILTIFDDGQGHAITPIAVDRVSETKVKIAVYDNNWPDQIRHVHVNLAKNTWSYQLWAGMTWSGNARTKTLGLAQPSAGLGHQPCFICSKGAGQGVGKTMQLRMTGDPRNGRHGAITVTDQSGEQSGCGPNGCFNRIKGAELIQPMTGVKPWRTDTPPAIDLPTRNSYRVDLGSTSKKGGVQESVKVIGRGFSVGAERIMIAEGENDQLRIGRRGNGVSFINDAKSTESPRLVVTSSNVTGGRDYELQIVPAGVNKKASIGVRFNPNKGKVRISNRDGSKVEKVALIVLAYGKQKIPPQEIDLKIKRGGSQAFTLGGKRG